MKLHIPQDVERLMWIVAESNDPGAVTDFESRFPEFVGELSKRRRMVSDLKGAKIHQTLETRIPAFSLRGEQRSPAPKGMWVVGGLAFAALVMATYSAVKMSNYQPPVLPKVEPVRTEPIENPPTTIYTPTPPPRSAQPAPPIQNPDPDPGSLSNEEQVKTLKLSDTSLIFALKMIGDMAGYRVDIAPGFEDQQVSVDYQATTSEMLKDLGMRYGFTAFDQGDGTIIIVPAIDGGNPISDGGGASRRIGG